MDLNLLLKGVRCSCGKTHRCDISAVYIEKDAAKRFSDLCAGYAKILIVADENTYRAAGNKVLSALSKKETVSVIFRGDVLLVPDEKAIEKVTEKTDGVDLIIGIGSGVIQDLCKYVSHFSKIPYMICATAPSMDGYASSGAAMILSGMKETVSAGVPLAIVADVDVLKNAPLEMIKAGYGDIIGKFSALCDWRLASAVNGEYLCEYIYDTTEKMIQKTLSVAGGLLTRDEESIKTLMEALITVGIMMSFAGSSRPASGSEHHLSHFFEIVGIVRSENYFSHGIDVAYSTVITSKIREKLARTEFPSLQYLPKRADYENKIKEIYGPVAEGCIALQDRVGSYKQNRIDVYLQKEAEIKELFARVPSSEEIEKMLSLAELDIQDFYAEYGEEKIKNAVLYAKDLKDRYSVLWLNYDLFGDCAFNITN